MNADAELTAHFITAVALWQRRSDLLLDCDVAGDWQATLGDIEAEYLEHVAKLATADPQHAQVRQAWLAGGDGASAHVAAHVLASSRVEALWDTLIGAAASRDGAAARVVAEALRCCTDDVMIPLTRRLLERDRPWLRRQLADVVARRRVSELAPLLRAGLHVRAKSLPDLEIIDALALLGDPESGPVLLDWVARLDPEEHGMWRTGCVRALCLIGHPQALELCEELIRSETGEWNEIPTLYARVGGPAVADLLLERLRISELPAWREGIATALGVLGTTRAVEPLLAVMAGGDGDLEAAADRALRQLLGVDPDDDVELAEWWRSHAGEFDPTVRYSEGQPMAIERELAWLEHPVPDDRALAVENLMLATGQHFAFDPRGLVADQRAGVARWQAWANANAAQLAAGAWWPNAFRRLRDTSIS